jgi:hypothetical protein
MPRAGRETVAVNEKALDPVALNGWGTQGLKHQDEVQWPK